MFVLFIKQMMLHKISIDKPLVTVVPLGYLKRKDKGKHMMPNGKMMLDKKMKPKNIMCKY